MAQPHDDRAGAASLLKPETDGSNFSTYFKKSSHTIVFLWPNFASDFSVVVTTPSKLTTFRCFAMYVSSSQVSDRSCQLLAGSRHAQAISSANTGSAAFTFPLSQRTR